ncbi:MAG TPA: type II toxin-antitoxin system RelE/ParE family toxin [Phenylobacterium sp.]
MTPEIRLFPAANARLDEIYDYTRETWGEAQAERYLRGLSTAFAAIARREVVWRPIPAEFGVNGWYARHERHFIYWKLLPDGALGVVTILHSRMHQMDRFREDAGEV